MDAESLNEFINGEKARLVDCDQDVKDAKRRISSHKGPSKRTRKQVKEEQQDSFSEGGASD